MGYARTDILLDPQLLSQGYRVTGGRSLIGRGHYHSVDPLRETGEEGTDARRFDTVVIS